MRIRSLCFSLLLTAVAGQSGTSTSESRHNRFARALRDGVALRILPLGASITVGIDSTGLNGYRNRLRELLEKDGNNVTYVGTRHVGTMRNNAVQAIPGQIIQQIDSTALQSKVYDFEPNIILINAGTNNCAKSGNTIKDSASAYAELLKHINQSLPSALTIVSNLVPNLKPEVNSCIDKLNPELYRVAMAASTTGQKIAFVDMNKAVPKSAINARDGTHPVDAGYEIMAKVWYEGLRRASVNITAAPTPHDPLPSDTDPPDSTIKPTLVPTGLPLPSTTSVTSGGTSPVPSHSSARRRVDLPVIYRTAYQVLAYLR